MRQMPTWSEFPTCGWTYARFVHDDKVAAGRDRVDAHCLACGAAVRERNDDAVRGHEGGAFVLRRQALTCRKDMAVIAYHDKRRLPGTHDHVGGRKA